MATYTKTDMVGGAPQWAIDRAKGIVSSTETILAVYVPSEQNIQNATRAPLVCLALPCYWPTAIICSPCLYMGMQSMESVLKSTVYVVTDKRVYKSIDASSTSQSFPCWNPGKVSGDVPLADITGMGLDLPGAGGQQCFPTTAVVLVLPMGHPLAHLGGGKRIPPTKMAMFIDNPQDAIQLLRQAKDTAAAAPIVYAAQVAQPMQMEREDPLEKIKKLKDLFDAGAITQAEFDEKKAALMERI
jgi:hypothetical protein